MVSTPNVYSALHSKVCKKGGVAPSLKFLYFLSAWKMTLVSGTVFVRNHSGTLIKLKESVRDSKTFWIITLLLFKISFKV